MAKTMNRVTLIGTLCLEPELRTMANGVSVANLIIATTDKWRDRDTTLLVERTEWHRVVLFGKLAEQAHKYMRAGYRIMAEGQLRTRRWQTPNGEIHQLTEVVVRLSTGLMILTHGSLVDIPQIPVDLLESNEANIPY